jgi:uncharacterized membrane protein YbhN (UPF0104 family)
MRNHIANILKVAVSLAGILVITLTQDMPQVFQLLSDLDWWAFVGGLLLILLGSFVRSFRWGTLVWALGIQVSWMRLTGLFFVGMFYNLFLPTGMGGDAVKMYELSRDDGKAASAISSVLVDRFLGLFVLFAMALLVLAGSYQLVRPDVRVLIVAGFLGCLIGVALLLQRTWIEAWGRCVGLDRWLGRFKILRKLYESIHLYGTAPLLRAIAASVVWNLILILAYCLLGLAVGIDLSIDYYFLLVPVISALLIVPSVGGLGIREGATVALFSRAGVSATQALALALAYDMTLIGTALVGAIIYVIQGLLGLRRR